MATTTGQVDTLGRTQPGLLTPGNTQLGYFQGGAQTTDANGNQYAPLVVQTGAGAPLNVQFPATALAGAVGSQAPTIPLNSTINGNTAATNNAVTATMAAVAAKTNFITGVIVTTQGGSAAAAGTLTLGGLIGGSSIVFELGANALYPVQFVLTFPEPIPASAVNTAITAAVSALGANTGAVSAVLLGFNQ